jgi:hypothetical protein
MPRESLLGICKRVMGLELTISCLGSKRSATELHPHFFGKNRQAFYPDTVILLGFISATCVTHFWMQDIILAPFDSLIIRD